MLSAFHATYQEVIAGSPITPTRISIDQNYNRAMSNYPPEALNSNEICGTPCCFSDALRSIIKASIIIYPSLSSPIFISHMCCRSFISPHSASKGEVFLIVGHWSLVISFSLALIQYKLQHDLASSVFRMAHR